MMTATTTSPAMVAAIAIQYIESSSIAAKYRSAQTVTYSVQMEWPKEKAPSGDAGAVLACAPFKSSRELFQGTRPAFAGWGIGRSPPPAIRTHCMPHNCPAPRGAFSYDRDKKAPPKQGLVDSKKSVQ